MKYEPILDVYDEATSTFPREAYLPLCEHVSIAGGWRVFTIHHSTFDGELIRLPVDFEHLQGMSPDTLVLIGTREIPETEFELQRCAEAARSSLG